MDKETTEEFIKKVIIEKKQDLLSVKMDLLFHHTQKKILGSETHLRKSFKKEKEKGKKSEVLETLESKINQLNALNKKINELNAIEPQIAEYINFLDKNKYHLF